MTLPRQARDTQVRETQYKRVGVPQNKTQHQVAIMYAAADEAGVMLQEGMWTRFFPATEHARTAMAEGEQNTTMAFLSTLFYVGL